MKKVGLITRETVVKELKDRSQDSAGCFLIGFNRIAADALTNVRNELRGSGARVFVAKNSLVQRAFADMGRDQDLSGVLTGETGVVLVYDEDVVKTCKVLVDFSKENEAFQIKGGYLGNEFIDSKNVAEMAKLPPKEVVIAMAVSGIASPLTGFLAMLNQIILKFLWTVEEIKKTKKQ